jgi:DNA-binding MarR family transcriptional regulator
MPATALQMAVPWLIDVAVMSIGMSDVAEHRLSELPPSAKLVVVVLTHEEPLTQQQLVQETRLSVRTVRRALTDLDAIGAIETAINWADARQKLYSLTDSPQSTSSVSEPGSGMV